MTSNKVSLSESAKKPTQKKYSQEYYKTNRDKLIAQTKKRAQEKAEAIKAYHRQYYMEHKEEITKQNQQYYQAHREEISIRRRKRYLEKREELIRRAREYQEKNREELKEKRKKYYQAKSGNFAEYRKAYYEENKELLRQKRRERYAASKEANNSSETSGKEIVARKRGRPRKSSDAPSLVSDKKIDGITEKKKMIRSANKDGVIMVAPKPPQPMSREEKAEPISPSTSDLFLIPLLKRSPEATVAVSAKKRGRPSKKA